MKNLSAVIAISLIAAPAANASFWELGNYGCTITDSYFVPQSNPAQIGGWSNGPRVVTVKIEPCDPESECQYYVEAVSTDKFYSGSIFDDLPDGSLTLRFTDDIATLNGDGSIVGMSVGITEGSRQVALFYFFGECTRF